MKNIRIISGVKYHVEKVPPDGGWGVLVGVGLAIPIVCKEKYISNSMKTKFRAKKKNKTVCPNICSLSGMHLWQPLFIRVFIYLHVYTDQIH